jgi:methyltransferase (TIGR00027 family)
MQSLADTAVFELDFPSTQAFKRARSEGLATTAKAIEYVGVHFEKERLSQALARSSHDPKLPTTFVWEGVTMYLPRLATESTLQDIAAASAPGSRLIMSYATPERVTASRFLTPIADRVFAALGEPIRGLMTTEECAKMLSRAGYSVESDGGAQDWARAFGYERRALLTIAERVVVAGRAGRP